MNDEPKPPEGLMVRYCDMDDMQAIDAIVNEDECDEACFRCDGGLCMPAAMVDTRDSAPDQDPRDHPNYEEPNEDPCAECDEDCFRCAVYGGLCNERLRWVP